MLTQLHIENVAVIERMTVGFGRGFSALTGETGAGKSILIDSIKLVLGERGTRDLIRAGAKSAYVSAIFEELSEPVREQLAQRGVSPDENGALLIEREVALDGRGQARMNGRPTTVSLLREIAGYLINIHGQHDNAVLLQPESHIRFLDSFAENGALLERYRALYRRAREIKRAIREISTDAEQRAARVDLLTYQVEEIEAAELRPGEEESLRERLALLKNGARIGRALGAAAEALADDERGAAALLSGAESALRDCAGISPELEALHGRLVELELEASDAAAEAVTLLDGLTFDETELERTSDRLETVLTLARKYGGSVSAALEYGEQSRRELEQLDRSEERTDELRLELRSCLAELKEAAGALTESRKKAGVLLETRIMEELASLDMGRVRGRVRFHAGIEIFLANGEVRYTVDGVDRVEFLIATNGGEEPKPLAKIASGGELSRIMLAMKTVLAAEDEVDTLIFDEIDTGVSGRAAEKIGRKIGCISREKQAFCVTHLSQIAALADHHYLIKKEEREGRSSTTVRELDFEGRKEELARMISGERITETALDAAEEMLKSQER